MIEELHVLVHYPINVNNNELYVLINDHLLLFAIVEQKKGKIRINKQ
jgi:hypothetical protein